MKEHVSEKDGVAEKGPAPKDPAVGEGEAASHEAPDLETAAKSGDAGAQDALWSAGAEQGSKKKHKGHDDHGHGKHKFDKKKGGGGGDDEDPYASKRFDADKIFEAVAKGEQEIKKGDSGLHVTKIQQALADVSFSVDVNGSYDAKTEAAVKKFQSGYSNEKFGKPGVFDQATLAKMVSMFSNRFPYTTAAKYADPKNQDAGVRDLSDDEKKAAYEALAEPKQASDSDKADNKDPDDLKFENEIKDSFWNKEVETRLKNVLNAAYQHYYASRAELRKHIGTKEEDKHFHKTEVLDAVAAESKREVDGIYENVADPEYVTDFSFDEGNLIDQWDDEEQTNKDLKKADKGKYDKKVIKAIYYYLTSDDALKALHTKHKADLTGKEEQKLLKPILDDLTSDEDKKKAILDIDVGWDGAADGGFIYLQRFKEGGDDTEGKEKNRVQMWELFQTCIHEYLHALAHEDFADYADNLDDETRANTLNEGFCEFFTVNVRARVNYNDTLKKAVEQKFYTKGAEPIKSASTYGSMAQAEQVISIVGIQNAHAAYFRGDLDKMGLS